MSISCKNATKTILNDLLKIVILDKKSPTKIYKFTEDEKKFIKLIENKLEIKLKVSSLEKIYSKFKKYLNEEIKNNLEESEMVGGNDKLIPYKEGSYIYNLRNDVIAFIVFLLAILFLVLAYARLQHSGIDEGIIEIYNAHIRISEIRNNSTSIMNLIFDITNEFVRQHSRRLISLLQTIVEPGMEICTPQGDNDTFLGWFLTLGSTLNSLMHPEQVSDCMGQMNLNIIARETIRINSDMRVVISMLNTMRVFGTTSIGYLIGRIYNRNLITQGQFNPEEVDEIRTILEERSVASQSNSSGTPTRRPRVPRVASPREIDFMNQEDDGDDNNSEVSMNEMYNKTPYNSQDPDAYGGKRKTKRRRGRRNNKKKSRKN